MRIFSLDLYREYSLLSSAYIIIAMPRRRRLRKIVAPPGFRGYKPYGVNSSKNESVELLYEEYEAIKLADYDLMNHLEASELMGISRPTFARIYESARRKIALALVETKEIKTTYGNAWMDKNWFICKDCYARFTIPINTRSHECPICKSGEIETIKQ
ncbi:MAG: DUF134 domain-containing protein [Bacteroidales bacterium]|nr:DUF134 domain-containing protein [Bacteroidales bacterium]